MIRVLIVDDHPVVRDGIAATLTDEPDFEVAGAAGSIAQAVATCAREHPDVVLLDLELPDGSGIDAIAKLHAVTPDAKVVIFTAYDSDERVLGAIRAGARGYLLKGATRDEIARAIRAVHAGGSHLESSAAARVMAQVRTPRRTLDLTAREKHVLRLVADGLSNKLIAESLAITERTVKFHVASIFNKLGADNRAQAVAMAIDRGVI